MISKVDQAASDPRSLAAVNARVCTIGHTISEGKFSTVTKAHIDKVEQQGEQILAPSHLALIEVQERILWVHF